MGCHLATLGMWEFARQSTGEAFGLSVSRRGDFNDEQRSLKDRNIGLITLSQSPLCEVSIWWEGVSQTPAEIAQVSRSDQTRSESWLWSSLAL